MRIEQLVYITEIAKTGLITNASERLYVSASAMSQAISSLEDELGVRLFERSRTGLEQTEVGKQLIIIAQEILDRIEEFKHKARGNSSEIEGNLSISAFPGLCRSILPSASAELKAKFPKVTLHIKESQPSQVRRDVLNGDADIGLIWSTASSREDNQLLTKKHIIDISLMICFRKDSELASKDIITMEDIYKYPIAVSLKDKNFYSIFGKYNKLNILVQSHNSDTKKHFISQGLAIGFEADLTIKADPFYQREDIIVKPVIGLESKLSYNCIRIKNQYLSLAGQEFLKELQVQAANVKIL